MANLLNTLSSSSLARPLAGGAAALALAAATVAPAQARDRDDGISAGEVIAGALIIGGIAAVVAAATDDDDDDRYYRDDNRYNQNYRYDNRGYDDGYYNSRYNNGRYNNGQYRQRRISSRQAVNRCVHATERRAGAYGYANVTDIRDIKRTRSGYRIKGRVQVNQGRYRGYRDNGKFTCYINYGQVSDIRLSGLGR